MCSIESQPWIMFTCKISIIVFNRPADNCMHFHKIDLHAPLYIVHVHNTTVICLLSLSLSIPPPPPSFPFSPPPPPSFHSPLPPSFPFSLPSFLLPFLSLLLLSPNSCSSMASLLKDLLGIMLVLITMPTVLNDLSSYCIPYL